MSATAAAIAATFRHCIASLARTTFCGVIEGAIDTLSRWSNWLKTQVQKLGIAHNGFAAMEFWGSIFTAAVAVAAANTVCLLVKFQMGNRVLVLFLGCFYPLENNTDALMICEQLVATLTGGLVHFLSRYLLYAFCVRADNVEWFIERVVGRHSFLWSLVSGFMQSYAMKVCGVAGVHQILLCVALLCWIVTAVKLVMRKEVSDLVALDIIRRCVWIYFEVLIGNLPTMFLWAAIPAIFGILSWASELQQLHNLYLFR